MGHPRDWQVTRLGRRHPPTATCLELEFLQGRVLPHRAAFLFSRSSTETRLHLSRFPLDICCYPTQAIFAERLHFLPVESLGADFPLGCLHPGHAQPRRQSSSARHVHPLREGEGEGREHSGSPGPGPGGSLQQTQNPDLPHPGAAPRGPKDSSPLKMEFKLR